MQGTYLGIYVNPVCAFWNYDPPLNCRFCTTGANVGCAEIGGQNRRRRRRDVPRGARGVGRHLRAPERRLPGFARARVVEPYVRAIKENVGTARRRAAHAREGLQRLRSPDRSRRRSLLVLLRAVRPANGSQRICPGKARVLGQQLFFDAMDYCAARMPRGAVSGEIIAGLEPIASTLAAIERITSVGAFPTVCVFRPTVGSDMEDWPPPDPNDMRQVIAAVYDAVPPPSRAYRPRAEYRGQPGRESRRRGAARAA